MRRQQNGNKLAAKRDITTIWLTAYLFNLNSQTLYIFRDIETQTTLSGFCHFEYRKSGYTVSIGCIVEYNIIHSTTISFILPNGN